MQNAENVLIDTEIKLTTGSRVSYTPAQTTNIPLIQQGNPVSYYGPNAAPLKVPPLTPLRMQQQTIILMPNTVK